MGYKRKTTRGSYGIGAIHEALQKIRAGDMSKRKAEAVYGVPRRTLTHHLNGAIEKPGCLGRFEPTFPQDLEVAVEEHVIQLQQRLFGVGTREMRTYAFDLAEKAKI
jgi:helix-turn-helix, Psq domain